MLEPPVNTTTRRFPDWIRVTSGGNENYYAVKNIVAGNKLHTVCAEANCPNVGECWGHGTATFMILGDVCTRGCKFCSVNKGRPPLYDTEEPKRLAGAVAQMKLRYVVITSVDRDDLPDGGAGIFAESIREIRHRCPGIEIEVLIPDFRGSAEALKMVLQARPDVLAHNLETVPSLYRLARGGGVYATSLSLLERVRAWAPDLVTKSSLMLGLGEEMEEVIEVMSDLCTCGVQILTLGQYLQPSVRELPVARFVPPEEFEGLARLGRDMGFAHVEAGPLVRSSYRAERQLKRCQAPVPGTSA
ncbi:MAG: lipoyl synthase [Candidatus Omnitrophica bacterium]|nr:lipoyl synthase [Candidatus Omnitrophota bacterium]